MSEQPGGTVTVKRNAWYVHLINRLQQFDVFIPQVQNKIVRALALSNQQQLRFKQQKEGVYIYTNQLLFDDYDTVVQLRFK